MAMIVYANAADYGNWTQTALPDGIDQLLRSASLRVARACMRDPYNDSPTGEAVDALRDATCAQAAAWLALGVSPDAAGLDTRVTVESKIGTGSVKYDAIPAADVQSAVADLAPLAREILTAAGLISLDLPVFTGDDYLLGFGHDRDQLDRPPYGLPQPIVFGGGLAEFPWS